MSKVQWSYKPKEAVRSNMFLYRGETEKVAARHQLDPDMVEALIMVESGGNRHAWNPEPKYRYFWDTQLKRPFRAVTAIEVASKVPPSDFHCLIADPDQEWWGQQASWGLMQVMGAVAREFGFQEPFLPQLVEACYGIEFGCAVLAERMRWAKGDSRSALAAYNGGKKGNESGELRNAGYADKVLARVDVVRGARILT